MVQLNCYWHNRTRLGFASLWHGAPLNPVPEALAHLAGFAHCLHAQKGLRDYTVYIYKGLVDQHLDIRSRRVTNLPAPLHALQISSDSRPRQAPARFIIMAVQHIMVF